MIDNQLGDTQDFTAMVNTLKQHGLRTYVDVVFNHMANESGIRGDLIYPNQQDMASTKKMLTITNPYACLRSF